MAVVFLDTIQYNFGFVTAEVNLTMSADLENDLEDNINQSFNFQDSVSLFLPQIKLINILTFSAFLRNVQKKNVLSFELLRLFSKV